MNSRATARARRPLSALSQILFAFVLSLVMAAPVATAQTTTYLLQVNVTNSNLGSGTISSSPAGITLCAGCNGTTGSFSAGTSVTLTATPSTGSTFQGWSGACSGTGACVVTMNAAQTVNATFAGSGASYVLQVNVTNNNLGSGTITSSPSGISSCAGCTGANATFNTGTIVTLTATPSSGSTFQGWSGPCSGTGSCVVTMSAAQTVGATFSGSGPTYVLNLSATNTGGTGTITSSPAGISLCAGCNGTNAPFSSGTVVTLTAAPTSGSTFQGWGGACSGTGICVVTMNATQNVTAAFAGAGTTSYALNLSVTDTNGGSGTVTSLPAGISCTGSCASGTASFTAGTSVTLTAAPASGSTFTGWGGACSGTGSCVIAMNATQNVTAAFAGAAPSSYALNLTVTDSSGGSGAVTSVPAGLNCSGSCTTGTASFAGGTSVTLTAAPTSGSTFSGWSGACSGTGACVVTMTSAQSVTAAFAGAAPANYPLNLTVTDSNGGSGTVISTPAGISCGGSCSTGTASFAAGASVTLTATPAGGSTFTGWSGACSGTASCIVTMNSAQSVTAAFSVKPTYTMTTATSGPGLGTVTGGGSFASGTAVILTATAASGSMFAGWSGACSGTASPTCQVTLTSNQTATAAFNLIYGVVRAGAVFSTAQPSSQSFLRLFNTSANAGTALVTLRDYATGNLIGQWASPSIPAGAEQQFAIGTIESGAGGNFTKPAFYSVIVQSSFAGYFQHVLWRASDGTLTNLSTCSSGVTADPAKLAGVHSSLLASAYPSTVVVNNSSVAAETVALDLYDATSGSKLGTYTTASIPASGEVTVTVPAIEAAIGVSPRAGQYHYVVQAQAGFTGFLQNLVNNQQAGVTTDMTSACAFGTPAAPATIASLGVGAVFSSAQPASQSFLRFYNTDTSAGTATVTLMDYASGQTLGQWTSPSIPAGAEQQFAISTVEAGTGATFTKPSFYSVSVQSGFNGYFQHVLWRASDGTLTNLSTCNEWVTADAARLSGVHSSLLAASYPSTVVVNNTGATANTVALDIYSAVDGTKLGTYATSPIPAYGQVIVPVTTIESAIRVNPSAGTYHYVVQAETGFTGFLQNLVNNQQAGVTTDMTTACAMPSAGTATSNAATMTATTVLKGNFSGSQSGTFEVVVDGTISTSSTTSAAARSSFERSQADTTLPIREGGLQLYPDGTVVPVTGSYDPSKKTLVLSGGGLTFTGTVSGAKIGGTVVGSDGVPGQFSASLYFFVMAFAEGQGRGSFAFSPEGIVDNKPPPGAASPISILYPVGTSVTVIAAPDPSSSVFRQWTKEMAEGVTDYCGGSKSQICNIPTITSVHGLTAIFDPIPNAANASTISVSVTDVAGGSGTVTSPAGIGSTVSTAAAPVGNHIVDATAAMGISCPGLVCSALFATNSTVTLTASSQNGSTVQWSGCTPNGNSCAVATGKAGSIENVSAAFTGPSNTLSVSVIKASGGDGTVTSVLSGITCPGTCSAPFQPNTTVTLTASPTTSSTVQWSGCTANGNSCTVNMGNAGTAPSVTATFTGPTTNALTVSVATASGGSGTVASSPTGIACPGTCTAQFQVNTNVILTATPASGSTVQWSGCTANGNACTVNTGAAGSNPNVTATFTGSSVPNVTLQIFKYGTGVGSVTSLPSGIDCGGTCSASFSSGTQVMLTATPATGSTFVGWDACPGTGTCTVKMSSGQTVGAFFNATQPLQSATLTVNVTNNGPNNVSVTATPNGLNGGSLNITCPANGTCSNQLTTYVGQVVTMSATWNASTTSLLGWTTPGNVGGCNVNVSPCPPFTLSGNLTQNVNFISTSSGGGGGGGSGGGTPTTSGNWSGTWTVDGGGTKNGVACTWETNAPLSMTLAINGSTVTVTNATLTATDHNTDCTTAGSTTYTGGTGFGSLIGGALHLSITIGGANLTLAGNLVDQSIAGTAIIGTNGGPVTLAKH